MGFFFRTPKPKPKITVEGIEITFDSNQECWTFIYRGTEFVSFGRELKLPTKAELDAILETLKLLKPEMRTRLQRGLKEWGESMLDDGETCDVGLEDYAQDGSFTACWSGGESWGDLGVDFTIKDGAIVEESWGD